MFFTNFISNFITGSIISDCSTNSSVTTRLLSFADLKAMRREDDSFCGENNEKRYLILIYTAEFDRQVLTTIFRIQYPLPLDFVGRPNVVEQQNLIRELKAEIRTFRNLRKPPKERDGLREEVKVYKRQRTGKSESIEERMKDQVAYLQKELSNLKSREQRESLERLQTSEKSLKAKVNKLVGELAFYRKKTVIPTRPQIELPVLPKIRRELCQTPKKGRVWIYSSHFRVNGRSCRCTSPKFVRSPARRFDPTAYVDEKRKKQELSRKMTFSQN
ncbi:coiled-coil domain-containing protein 61-like [Octopus sinensis]|uniref:Coiled-coil domain-containing protein 61-like n=1 Tax=Octopus sinensis TaxID=2607531 RepID=A0A7E6EHU9_9MOLL|nr:coiled-coil domain-containing protein 61-like [Octopus sinensis]